MGSVCCGCVHELCIGLACCMFDHSLIVQNYVKTAIIMDYIHPNDSTIRGGRRRQEAAARKSGTGRVRWCQVCPNVIVWPTPLCTLAGALHWSLSLCSAYPTPHTSTGSPKTDTWTTQHSFASSPTCSTGSSHSMHHSSRTHSTKSNTLVSTTISTVTRTPCTF